MKIINYLIIIFICINPSVKAESKETLIEELQKGGKLIFIRHAYAPGGGDPDNFDINDCTTQRNLSNSGSCLLYTSPSPRDATLSRMPSSA